MKEIKYIAIALMGDAPPCFCGGEHEICLRCEVCRAGMPDQTADPAAPISSLIDATILRANALRGDISSLCQTAVEHRCASVCVNSIYLDLVKQSLASRVKTCTVVNFPLGACNPHAVADEARSVCEMGVDEVDMVQSISSLLNRDHDAVFEVIKSVADICRRYKALLKVIIETCYLNREEIIISCLIAKKAGAEFVKTSTGFGSNGATAENIALMRQTVGPKVGVKASGGIRTRDQALLMIASGANRIGASNVLALIT